MERSYKRAHRKTIEKSDISASSVSKASPGRSPTDSCRCQLEELRPLRVYAALGFCPYPQEAETMTYREFAMPSIARRSSTVEEWMRWLDQEGVLAPTSPRPDASCELCG